VLCLPVLPACLPPGWELSPTQCSLWMQVVVKGRVLCLQILFTHTHKRTCTHRHSSCLHHPHYPIALRVSVNLGAQIIITGFSEPAYTQQSRALGVRMQSMGCPSLAHRISCLFPFLPSPPLASRQHTLLCCTYHMHPPALALSRFIILMSKLPPTCSLHACDR
jgi:hypothetical protein